MTIPITRLFDERIYLRDYEPEAPRLPLLWIHGLGESGLCFEEIALHRGLAGRRQLVPDLPGYGRSLRPPEPTSLEAQADGLAKLIAARCPGPAVLVGHSLGGVVALLLAERHPEAVAGLIDIDGNISRADCVFSGRAAAAPLTAFLEGKYARLLDQIYLDGVGDPALRGYYASLRLAWPEAFHRNSAELVALSEPEDLARRLAALPMPSLYIAGRPGGASQRSIGLLAEAGVEVEEVSPSGHWPFIGQPERFIASLLPFLERERL